MGIASGVFVSPAERAVHAGTNASAGVAPDCGLSVSCAVDTPWAGVLGVLAIGLVAAGLAARRGRRMRSKHRSGGT